MAKAKKAAAKKTTKKAAPKKAVKKVEHTPDPLAGLTDAEKVSDVLNNKAEL